MRYTETNHTIPGSTGVGIKLHYNPNVTKYCKLIGVALGTFII